MSRWRFAIAVVALGMLLGVLLEAGTLVQRRTAAPRNDVPAATPSTAMAPSPATPSHAALPAASVRAPGAAVPHPPLPPPDTPLAKVLPALREAGLAGDGPSACRYAMEVVRCRDHFRDVKMADSMRESAANGKLPAAVRDDARAHLEATLARIARDAPVCHGLPPEVAADAWRVLFGAAREGHGPSIAKFATVRELLEASPGDWDLDALSAYRTYGLPFLERAAASGDTAAIERLGLEKLRRGQGARAVPYDPVTGLAYLKALAANAEPAYRDALAPKIASAIADSGLTPAEVDAASARAGTILPLRLAQPYSAAAPGPQDDFGCR